jgi:hypothetical protein
MPNANLETPKITNYGNAIIPIAFMNKNPKTFA